LATKQLKVYREIQNNDLTGHTLLDCNIQHCITYLKNELKGSADFDEKKLK